MICQSCKIKRICKIREMIVEHQDNVSLDVSSCLYSQVLQPPVPVQSAAPSQSRERMLIDLNRLEKKEPCAPSAKDCSICGEPTAGVCSCCQKPLCESCQTSDASTGKAFCEECWDTYTPEEMIKK